MMHGHEKSDSAIVATKPPNKAGRPAAEAVEQRAEAKENANRCRTCRTQGRESVSQEPERVRTAARPAVKHPRWEPYAGKLHVRFSAGGAQ
jgi:RNA-directed DNA polymerase